MISIIHSRAGRILLAVEWDAGITSRNLPVKYHPLTVRVVPSVFKYGPIATSASIMILPAAYIHPKKNWQSLGASHQGNLSSPGRSQLRSGGMSDSTSCRR